MNELESLRSQLVATFGQSLAFADRIQELNQQNADLLAVCEAWARMLDLDMELDDPEIPDFVATEDERIAQYELAAQLTRAVLAQLAKE